MKKIASITALMVLLISTGQAKAQSQECAFIAKDIQRHEQLIKKGGTSRQIEQWENEIKRLKEESSKKDC